MALVDREPDDVPVPAGFRSVRTCGARQQGAEQASAGSSKTVRSRGGMWPREPVRATCPQQEVKQVLGDARQSAELIALVDW